jgi:hypothetical protein
LKIHIKQPYWFKDGSRRVFMYGFQDIVAEFREYSQDEAEFVTPFSLQGTDRRFTSVGAPQVTTPTGTPAFNHNTVQHELYFDDSLTEQFDFDTEIFQTVQTVYVKTIMRTEGNEVPIIREMELPYRHEEISI